MTEQNNRRKTSLIELKKARIPGEFVTGALKDRDIAYLLEVVNSLQVGDRLYVGELFPERLARNKETFIQKGWDLAGVPTHNIRVITAESSAAYAGKFNQGASARL